MTVELKVANPELVDILPKWALDPELKEYFRSWPALQDWNRPDLISQRLDWAYGIYEDGKLVGLVQLYYPNLVSKTVEMGMLIDNKLCQDRFNVSFEAHKQMVDYVFNKLDYQKILMRILDHRSKLLHRMYQFGYQQEGHLQRSVKLDGKLRNEYLIALYRELK